MLAESNEPVAEEWAIHDFENFGRLRLGEFEDLELIARVGELMRKHGEMFAGLVEHFGGVSAVEEAAAYMRDGYCGAFDSLEDYARELVEDCYSGELERLPDFIRYHIDYEGIARDMELGGDVFTVECDGQVHVFNAHV